MVVKVAMADHFQFKVMPSIKNFCLLKQGDVHYIGGTDILPAPLGASLIFLSLSYELIALISPIVPIDIKSSTPTPVLSNFFAI